MTDYKKIADYLGEIFRAKPPVRDPVDYGVPLETPPVVTKPVEIPVAPINTNTTSIPSVSTTMQITPSYSTNAMAYDGYTPIEAKSIKWRVPVDTKQVVVQVCESNGRLINEYTISNFITLHPGQILRVLAK